MARTHLAHPPHANCRRACDDAQALGVLLQRLDHLLDTAPQRLGAGRLFDALERLPGPPPVRRRFPVSRRKGRAAPRHKVTQREERERERESKREREREGKREGEKDEKENERERY